MQQILYFSSNLPYYWNKSTPIPLFTMRVELYFGSFNDSDSDILNIKKIEYVPQKGDKIFFLPGVNVPRIKFKNVAVEYDVKTTRDVETANIIIGNRRSIHLITDSLWSHKFSVEAMHAFIEKVSDAMDGQSLQKVKDCLEFYENPIIAVDGSLAKWINDFCPKFASSGYSDRLTFILPHEIELYEKIKDVTIYNEATVIKLLNGEDATVIDKKMYDYICGMFESTDTDNHVLAMEILANSNYNESLVYIELIFKRYHAVMEKSHTKNHVNFQSLVSYLGKNKNYFGTTLDGAFNSLAEKDLLTKENLDILLSDSYVSNSEICASTFLTVKTVTLTEEGSKFFDGNYIIDLTGESEIVTEAPEMLTLQTAEPVIEKPVEEVVEEETESEFAAEDNWEVISHVYDEPEEEKPQEEIKTETNESRDSIDWF